MLRVGAVASGPAIEALVSTLADALAKSNIEGRLWIVEPGRVREYLGAEPD